MSTIGNGSQTWTLTRVMRICAAAQMLSCLTYPSLLLAKTPDAVSGSATLTAMRRLGPQTGWAMNAVRAGLPGHPARHSPNSHVVTGGVSRKRRAGDWGQRDKGASARRDCQLPVHYRIAIVLGAVVGNHAIQLRHAMKPQFDLPSHHVR